MIQSYTQTAQSQTYRIIGLFLFFLCGVATHNAHGFGFTGHRVVGQIAENHLNDSSKIEIKQLLGHTRLAEIATWADEIRVDPRWKKANPWHYINVNRNETIAEAAQRQEQHIIAAIERFQTVLKNNEESSEKRLEALKFLVHLVGDIHLPVHTGLAEDKGATLFQVNWLGQGRTLHWIWDSGIINSQELSFSEWARFLDNVNPEKVKQWQADSVFDWATESLDYRPKVYEFPRKTRPVPLGYSYLYTHLPFIKQRLTQAGIRLAGILNATFTNDTTPNTNPGE